VGGRPRPNPQCDLTNNTAANLTVFSTDLEGPEALEFNVVKRRVRRLQLRLAVIAASI
jgi:hypothetical protein